MFGEMEHEVCQDVRQDIQEAHEPCVAEKGVKEAEGPKERRCIGKRGALSQILLITVKQPITRGHVVKKNNRDSIRNRVRKVWQSMKYIKDDVRHFQGGRGSWAFVGICKHSSSKRLIAHLHRMWLSSGTAYC